MATILIAGGTGMIGTALCKRLTGKGHSVIILTRQPKTTEQPGISYVTWDPAQQKIPAAAIQQADYIINVAGAGVADKRWTARRKKEIIHSRVDSGVLIVQALRDIPNQVKAVVNASAIGWYGPDPAIPNPHPFTEEAPMAPGFLGETCQAWENSIQPVSALGKRLVILRIGIVLSTAGGALPAFQKPVRMGVAGILGSGRQVISWIHIEDLCRLFEWAIEKEEMEGIYNAVAPGPVNNKTFNLTLARKMRDKSYIPLYVPAFALKLALGELSIEVLKSATVSCEKIHQTGFRFLFPHVESAFDDLLKK